MERVLRPLQQIIRQYNLPTVKPHLLRPGLWHLLSNFRVRVIGQPSVVQNESVRKALNSMPKAAFYAVRTGHKPGIYQTWGEAEAQVKGFPSAKFQKFPTEAAAQQFMNNSVIYPKTHTAVASTSSNGSSAKIRAPPGSPPSAIDPTLLPADLQEIASQGYSFSKDHRLVVYTDGSGLSNGKAGARAGLGVYWGQGEAGKQNLSERVPGEVQTNNRGELLAIIRAVETCPYPSIPLQIRSDSQYAISCMTTFLPKWMSNGFRTASSKPNPYDRSNAKRSKGAEPIKNADLIKHLLVLLRRRGPKAAVTFKHVTAHVGLEGNEAADKLANRGAIMPELPDRTDWLDPDDPDVASEPLSDPVNIDLMINEDWLLTEDEMNALERDFKLQP